MTEGERITISAKLWVWRSAESIGSWHFLTLDGEAAETIGAHEAMRRLEFGKGRGFGAVTVEVRIGVSTWRTSVFPSKPHDGYLLPVKAGIRKAEGLAEGDKVEAEVALL